MYEVQDQDVQDRLSSCFPSCDYDVATYLLAFFALHPTKTVVPSNIYAILCVYNKVIYINYDGNIAWSSIAKVIYKLWWENSVV